MQTIYIDIQQRDIRQIIHAKQADSQSRFFKVILLDGGATFAVPTGAKPSIWFDGSVPGWYDTITLPNGTKRSAFSVSGNEITCELAEQAVASSGTVLCCLVLNTSSGYQLGAWNIAIDVEAVPAMDSPEATEYFNAFEATVADAIDAAERAEEAAKKIDPATYYTKTQADALLANKAPKSHAVTATTYGLGTSSYYGHLKLSDSTTSTSSTSSGIAATPYAVKLAKDAASTAQTTANNAASAAATAQSTANNAASAAATAQTTANTKLYMKQLWTNSSPTSDFAAHSVSVGDLSPYDVLCIAYRASKSGSGTVMVFSKAGNPNICSITMYVPENSGFTPVYRAGIPSAATIAFEAGTNTATGVGGNAGIAIPIAVYGIKGVQS